MAATPWAQWVTLYTVEVAMLRKVTMMGLGSPAAPEPPRPCTQNMLEPLYPFTFINLKGMLP